MATSTITPDQDAIVAEIFIAAPRERVFQAISDPAQTSQWWGNKGLYRVTGGHAEVRVGGTWLSEGVGADGTKFHVNGEYLEVDPPKLLVHTWKSSYDPGLNTTVRWELESQGVHTLQQSGPHKMGTGTLVRIHHTGFAGNYQSAASHGEGWKRVLGWLRGFAEKGETIDNRPS